MIAMGGYLRGLREVSGISQVQLAADVGRRLRRDVQSTTIWRIESGKMIPGGDLLVVLLDILGGSIADLARLQEDTAADADTGRAAAVAWFRAAAEGATEDERRRVAEHLRRLADEIASGQATLPRA